MTTQQTLQIERNTIALSFVDRKVQFQLEVGGPDNISVSPSGDIEIAFPTPGNQRTLTFLLEDDDLRFAGFFAVPAGKKITIEDQPIRRGPVPETSLGVVETSARHLTITDIYTKNASFPYALYFELVADKDIFFIDPEIKNEGGMIVPGTSDTSCLAGQSARELLVLA